MLVDTTIEALVATGVERLVVSGRRVGERAPAGAHDRSRAAPSASRCSSRGSALCTDNAAMIALAGLPRLAAGEDDGLDARTPRRTCRSAAPWSGLMGARREAREALAAAGLRPRKRWGQHFLCDGGVARRIVDTADVGRGHGRPRDRAGPRRADRRARRACRHASTSSRSTAASPRGWRRATPTSPHVRVLVGDVLELPLDDAGRRAAGDRGREPAVQHREPGALPAARAARAAFRAPCSCCSARWPTGWWRAPGATRTAWRRSLVQAFADVRIAFRVSRRSFLPPPAVDSAVVDVALARGAASRRRRRGALPRGRARRLRTAAEDAAERARRLGSPTSAGPTRRGDARAGRRSTRRRAPRRLDLAAFAPSRARRSAS